jgi:predicted PurR-regulated permease PerM
MAPGVAGALIATVVGLFVAIPAMFAYNFMVTSIRAITQELDAFATEFATAVEHAHVDNRPIGEEITEANQVLATAITKANESLLSRLTALLQPR